MRHRIYCSNFEVKNKLMFPFQNSSELHVAFYKKAIEIGSLSKMISGYLNADLSVLNTNGREDDSIYFSGDIIRQSDSLAPHIMRVQQERFSEQSICMLNQYKDLPTDCSKTVIVWKNVIVMAVNFCPF